MTIASVQPRFVIVYVREHQNLRPEIGVEAMLRMRSIPRRSWYAVIDRVGAQVEEVPPHHRRDPQVIEWGVPVRLALPDDSMLKPGELVDVRFGSRVLLSG